MRLTLLTPDEAAQIDALNDIAREGDDPAQIFAVERAFLGGTLEELGLL
ncbi:hypothetical protein OG474_29915 [Kribbella sp. NBC_01505]